MLIFKNYYAGLVRISLAIFVWNMIICFLKTIIFFDINVHLTCWVVLENIVHVWQENYFKSNIIWSLLYMESCLLQIAINTGNHAFNRLTILGLFGIFIYFSPYFRYCIYVYIFYIILLVLASIKFLWRSGKIQFA